MYVSNIRFRDRLTLSFWYIYTGCYSIIQRKNCLILGFLMSKTYAIIIPMFSVFTKVFYFIYLVPANNFIELFTVDSTRIQFQNSIYGNQIDDTKNYWHSLTIAVAVPTYNTILLCILITICSLNNSDNDQTKFTQQNHDKNVKNSCNFTDKWSRVQFWPWLLRYWT